MVKSVLATMPGLVARVEVNLGDKILKGQGVVVLNVMKTEIVVESPFNGIVKKILLKEWDEVKIDDPLIILEI
jgi:methylmalonyl-CoA carboxyltransferase small subunit